MGIKPETNNLSIIIADLLTSGAIHLDLAIGAPGSDDVMILYTSPVVHVNVTLSVVPSRLNLIDDNATRQYFCEGNSAKLCIAVVACFNAYGHHIPEVISQFKVVETILL